MLSLPDFKEKQIVFVLLSRGEKLSFKNDNLVVLYENGRTKLQTTCYRLFAVFVVGHITITSGLIERSKRFGFSIILMAHNFKVYSVISAQAEGNTLLRSKQYSYNKFEIAQYLVINKIRSQIATLEKIRNKSVILKNSIELLKNYLLRLPNESLDLKEILGIEGISSRVYFASIFEDCNWKSRRPRVKEDIINCLLDIGYTYLFCIVEAILNCYGFDIYKGVYHREFYNRKSLVCDLVEPFRPIIDYSIRKAYNLRVIRVEDFSLIQGRYNLFGESSKKYISFLLKSILDRKEDMFLFIQRYYRSFMKDLNIREYPTFEL